MDNTNQINENVVSPVSENAVSPVSESAVPPVSERAVPPVSEKPVPTAEEIEEKKRKRKRILKIVGRVLAVFLITVVAVLSALLGVIYTLEKGPSVSARNLFVMSVRETSAIGFLADFFLTEEEIAEIESTGIVEFESTDTSLITMTSTEIGESNADAWGLVDDDGDGIIIETVTGEGYIGYMMVVLDPSRVILGTDPANYGCKSYTVEEMVKKFDAVAGTNAGGFEDLNGQGDGSMPETFVVFEGTIYNGGAGAGNGFVGIDSNYIMHVGLKSGYAVREADIQYGVSFGPVLIQNGEPVPADTLYSGVNPRTAIGQRSDGAILMLVIDGRQVISLGATFEDLVNIMLDYGAVNACNMDGGSSTMMWYNDGYVNNCASVIGIRPVPTAWLVLKEGVERNG